MNNRKGFTLVEVIVILAVIAILAAIAVPVVLKIFERTAEDATREEMDNLKKAMIGDPEKLQSRVRSDFGLLGDIGCLPTTAVGGLDRLLSQGTYPAWSFSPTAQIGAGWKGPYITGAATGEEAEVFKNDQWGNPYTYTPAAGPCPLTAALTSNGPSISSTSDDITLTISATETTATVSGFIKDPSGNPVRNSSVTINYPANGALTTSSATTDSSGFYSFSNIPFGKSSITFPSGSPKLIVTTSRTLTGTGPVECGTGVAKGSNCTVVEFKLVNFSTSAASVTSLRADYTSTPAAFYYRIFWGTSNLECGGAAACPAPNTQSAASGETVTFAAQSVGAASSGLRPSVFVVDSAQTQLSDIQIGKAGEVGTAVTVKLVNFRDCATSQSCGGAGASVSMAGVPFTITLSNGSVVQFTPP